MLQAASVTASWTLRSVTVDGVDTTDTPIDFNRGDVDNIEVLLTQRVTELSGTVTSDRGMKVVDGTVVAFSPDRHGGRGSAASSLRHVSTRTAGFSSVDCRRPRTSSSRSTISNQATSAIRKSSNVSCHEGRASHSARERTVRSI
jgi:hypothetical protein